jgi:CubicO group peptidase (beta-lactamase class C family)
MHGFDRRFEDAARNLKDRRLSRRAALIQGSAGLAAGALAAAGMTAAAHAQEASPAATSPVDLSGVMPQTLSGERLAEFKRYFAARLAEVGIPGSAVAVVQGGQVVFEQAFGVKEVGGSDPVTLDTMFMIGSVTKSMTSMMAGTLVDDGRLTWETPLVDLLPEFAVDDPELTSSLTIADAFGAATGVPRRDVELILTAPGRTTDELIDHLAELPLTAPFGEAYQYSNQMYAVGGYAAASAAGGGPANLPESYRLAMREQILNPIGMTQSTFALDEVLATGNYSLSHAEDIYGQRQHISLLSEDRFVTAVAPAGALWSNVQEMARYVQTLLADGAAPDGQRVISPENLGRIVAPGVEIPHGPGESPHLSEGARTYAKGWVTGSYKGQPTRGHAGSTMGFISQVTFLPEADLGVVILTNDTMAGTMFTIAIQYYLFELLFDQPREVESIIDPLLEQWDQQADERRATLGPVDTAAVEPWLGRYTNEDLGDAFLRLEGDALVVGVGEFKSELRSIQDETAYALADPPLFSEIISLTLGTGADGGPEIVAPSVEDITYTFTPIGA